MQVYTKFRPIATRRNRRRSLSPMVAAIALVCIAGGGGWVWFRWNPRQTSVNRASPIGSVAHASVTNTNGSSPDEPVRVNRLVASLPSTERSSIPVPTSLETNFPMLTEGAYPRSVQDLVEAQLAMARQAISPGSLDGAKGSRTRAALIAFQHRSGLPESGLLDVLTRSKLMLTSPPLTNYVVSTNDLFRLRPLGRNWLEKSRQDAMDYETILELVSEFSRSNPALIRSLNPQIDWTNIQAGTFVIVPNVSRQAPPERATFARIGLDERMLDVFDSRSNLVAHFPCSVAKFAEKRPLGELHVAVLAPNPNYTFDPVNFPESAEARKIDRKLVLQPGPNNPVGTVWIGLDRPGYGIHGTPLPDQVGRAESHGCFRLANWNAEYFLQLAWVGMPVFVEP